jgi:hypothetical protein
MICFLLLQEFRIPPNSCRNITNGGDNRVYLKNIPARG